MFMGGRIANPPGCMTRRPGSVFCCMKAPATHPAVRFSKRVAGLAPRPCSSLATALTRNSFQSIFRLSRWPSRRSAFQGEGFTNVTFREADIGNLPFQASTFDHVFVCFTLEHIPDPLRALGNLKKVLRPGGTITAIEGDHGSAIFYPDTPAAHHVIDCLVALQRQADAGFEDVKVSPLQTYATPSIPHSSEAVKSIFIAMIEGIREQAIAGGLSDPEAWDTGIRDLYRTTEQNGMFCYTFFKAVGRKGGAGP